MLTASRIVRVDVDMQNALRNSYSFKKFPRKQKGAAAIEFAAVFVIFFAVFYGLVSYSLPLLMMQSFNAAATEAVRRAVALDPSSANYATTVKTVAQNAVLAQLSWMPAALAFDVTTDSTSTYNTATKLLTVTISYPQSKLTNVLPTLVLPIIGQVPSLPASLIATASLQLAP
jgi:Flp pilus assembly protein TadG